MPKHQFTKGQKKTPGSGMKKGQKTKKGAQWEALGEYITGQLTEDALKYLMSLSPSDRFEQYLKLLEYFKPKLSRSEQKHEITNELQSAILKAFDDGEAVQSEPGTPPEVIT